MALNRLMSMLMSMSIKYLYIAKSRRSIWK